MEYILTLSNGKMIQNATRNRVIGVPSGAIWNNDALRDKLADFSSK